MERERRKRDIGIKRLGRRGRGPVIYLNRRMRVNRKKERRKDEMK